MFLVLSVRCCRTITWRAKTVEMLAFLMNVRKTVASRLIVYEKGRVYFLNDTEVNFVLLGGGGQRRANFMR